MRRDVQDIFRLTPHEKQCMMFSATLSKEIRPVCRKFMQDVSTTGFCNAEVSRSVHGGPRLQITPAWTCLVTPMSLIIWIRCVWFGLELNSADLWPSRNWVWDQCFNECQFAGFCCHFSSVSVRHIDITLKTSWILWKKLYFLASLFTSMSVFCWVQNFI